MKNLVSGKDYCRLTDGQVIFWATDIRSGWKFKVSRGFLRGECKLLPFLFFYLCQGLIERERDNSDRDDRKIANQSGQQTNDQ